MSLRIFKSGKQSRSKSVCIDVCTKFLLNNVDLSCIFFGSTEKRTGFFIPVNNWCNSCIHSIFKSYFSKNMNPFHTCILQKENAFMFQMRGKQYSTLTTSTHMQCKRRERERERQRNKYRYTMSKDFGSFNIWIHRFHSGIQSHCSFLAVIDALCIFQRYQQRSTCDRDLHTATLGWIGTSLCTSSFAYAISASYPTGFSSPFSFFHFIFNRTHSITCKTITQSECQFNWLQYTTHTHTRARHIKQY